MAVKAQDSVTVYDFNDISKVRTWYKLVPRTSSAPTVAANATEAQMTSNGWTTTEPAVDTAKKLYTVQQNIFGDGSYVWGEVSLSSSYEAAIQAYNKASAAEGAANETAKYFWFNSTDSGAGEGAGAHITEKTKEAFIADPANGGGNVLIDSDSIEIRDGTTPLASFGADGAQIGQDNKSRIEMTNDGMIVYGHDSTSMVTMAHIGCDRRKTIGGGYITKPYTTLGTRVESANQYSSTSTYSYGDVVTYNEEIYVCIAPITTAEAWTPSHWQLVVIGSYSNAEGARTVASGDYSHAEGNQTRAIGFGSHAEGGTNSTYVRKTTAIGELSHAEGFGTTAVGSGSHSEGKWTTADATGAHAEGEETEAIGTDSHAEGSYTSATRTAAHAEGYNTEASANYGHAEGEYSVASGISSHAQNIGTKANKYGQTALGTWNKVDTIPSSSVHPDGTQYGHYAVIIGNGTGENARSNALTVDWKGNVEAAGEITGATVEVPISVTRSTGTLVSAVAYKYGKIVNLQVTVYNTASVAAGSNIFVGQINTTDLIPMAVASGASYWGSHSVGGTISTAGQIVVRNASPTAYATSASQPINMSFMYLVD